MTAIRPLEREDLGVVATLYGDVMRPGVPPRSDLKERFAALLLEQPWADPEIPSLVAVDEGGSVVGFLGSHVRRIRLDGRSGRLACAGQLVVAPAARHRATGALLLHAYLAGPQDLTITDGATEEVRRIWERLGGEAVWLGGIEWYRPLRPAALAALLWGHRSGRDARALMPIARGVDRAALSLGRAIRGRARAAGRANAKTTQDVHVGELTPEDLVAALPQLTRRLRLWVDYDTAFAEHLLVELRRVPGRGSLRAALVRTGAGTVLGAYVYYLRNAGLSSVVAIAAPDEDGASATLDALVDDARAHGAAALHGRLEPRIALGVTRMRCLMRYEGGALVHARDPSVLAAAGSRSALLTRLEGEWWMGLHLDDGDRRATEEG